MIARNGEFDELGQLTAALCDGEITPQQAARLEQLAGESDRAWRYFCECTQIHSDLVALQLGGGEAPELDAQQVELQVPRQKHVASGPRRSRPLLYAALAGSVLLACTAVVIQWYRTPDEQIPQSPAVARLVGAVDAEWSDDGAPDADGRVVAGRELVLRQGFAAIEFDGGARVILQAPAVFGPQSATGGVISQGSLTARAPAEAVGFTIRTPTLAVVDLGTEFGVAVEPSGASEVEVFAGQVEVSLGDERDASPTKHAMQGGQSLRAVPSLVAGDPPQVEWLAAGTRQFVRRLPGSVARLRALVAAETHLLHHYTFEGPTVEERCRDKRGDLHLGEIAMRDGRDGGELDFSPAWLETAGHALRSFRAAQRGNLKGVGLQSQAVFQPPKAMTVELLLRCDDVAKDRPGAIMAAVATRANRRGCSFLVTALDHGELAHLLDGEAPWLLSGFDFVPGHWYYVACTFLAEGDQETTINSYLANLSDGDCTLKWAVRDRRTPGVPAASRLGIGKGLDGDAADAYPWSGVLDEIAIYGTVLDRDVLQAHLATLVGGR